MTIDPLSMDRLPNLIKFLLIFQVVDSLVTQIIDLYAFMLHN